MTERIIRRLPTASYIVGRKCNCPICERRANTYIDALVELRPLMKIPVISRCELLYCLYCELPFINDEIAKKIREDNNGFSVMEFKAEQKNVNGTRLMVYNLDLTKSYEKDYSMSQLSQFRKHKKRLRQVESALCMICVDVENEPRDVIIVGDEKDQNAEKDVFFYASEEARVLLSAIWIKKKYLRDVYKNRKIIIRQLIEAEYVKGRLPDMICSKRVNILSESKNHILATKQATLLYSPFNNRYEVIMAVVKKSKTYVEASIFREFVKKYGNPGVELSFVDSVTDWESDYPYACLKNESILKGYGYSVGLLDHKSTELRQELLAEMIDLEIVTVSQLKRWLEFFKSSHKSAKYQFARDCWEEDEKFVLSYTPNPKRFLSLKRNVE